MDALSIERIKLVLAVGVTFAIGLSGWGNLFSTSVEETVISLCHTRCKGNKYFENPSQISGHINEKILLSVNGHFADTFVSSTSLLGILFIMDSLRLAKKMAKKTLVPQIRAWTWEYVGGKGGSWRETLLYTTRSFRRNSLSRYLQRGKMPTQNKKNNNFTQLRNI